METIKFIICIMHEELGCVYMRINEMADAILNSKEKILI